MNTKSQIAEAYIDAANLHRCLHTLGWRIDFARFNTWLIDKYGIEHAYFFMGFIPKYQYLYTSIQKAGFILIFKEVVYEHTGKAKGNCDVDIVIHAINRFYEQKPRSIIPVTSDGDFAGLVKFFQTHGVNVSIISPAQPEKCSLLLKRTGAPIVYLGEHRNKLEKR